MINKFILRTLPVLAVIALNPLFVAAQIEEIVVTAQKRAESLQDVPISIQAFTGEELNNLGITNSYDVLRLIPGGGVVPQGGSKQNFFIRGVGTADFHLNVVGAVGVYLDDVAINSPNAINFSTFDTERVEILRGPQNILFGRNTTGGAVNYISRKPDADEGLNGYLRAGYGNYDAINTEGALGFALSDNLAGRVSAISNLRDGIFDNVATGEDEGTIDRQAIRAQFLFTPTDDLEILGSYRWGRSRGQPEPYKMVGLLDPTTPLLPNPDGAPTIPNPCSVPYDDILHQAVPLCSDYVGNTFQYSDWEEVHNGMPFKEKIDSWGGTLRLAWDIGSMTLTSISSYDSFKVKFREDSDGAPTTIFQFYQDAEYDQWSQEVRLQSGADRSLRWILGFYYFFEEADYSTVVRRTPPGYAPSGPGFFNITPNTQVLQDNEVFSGYGQVEFDLQENLKATAGFRWTHETKTGTNTPSVRCVNPGPPFCPRVQEHAFFGRDNTPNLPGLFVPPVEILDANNKEWGARFSLDYKITEDALWYASISRGFKGGGFSIAALQALNGLAGQSVEPEVLMAYETGFKSTWLNGGLQVNGAVYYYEWDNLQSFQPLLDQASGEAIPQLLNVPESSMIGGELEIQWVPAEGWYLATGVNINDGEFDDVGNIVSAKVGNSLPNNPDVSYTGLLRKEIPLAAGTLALQTNWRYKDDHTFDLANARNLSEGSYWNLAARGSYAFGKNEAFEISVWGDNLTGAKYCRGKTSLEGLSEALLCLPNLSEPTYGVSVQYRYE